MSHSSYICIRPSSSNTPVHHRRFPQKLYFHQTFLLVIFQSIIEGSHRGYIFIRPSSSNTPVRLPSKGPTAATSSSGLLPGKSSHICTRFSSGTKQPHLHQVFFWGKATTSASGLQQLHLHQTLFLVILQYIIQAPKEVTPLSDLLLQSAIEGSHSSYIFIRPFF